MAIDQHDVLVVSRTGRHLHSAHQIRIPDDLLLHAYMLYVYVHCTPIIGLVNYLQSQSIQILFKY